MSQRFEGVYRCGMIHGDGSFRIAIPLYRDVGGVEIVCYTEEFDPLRWTHGKHYKITIEEVAPTNEGVPT